MADMTILGDGIISQKECPELKVTWLQKEPKRPSDAVLVLEDVVKVNGDQEVQESLDGHDLKGLPDGEHAGVVHVDIRVAGRPGLAGVVVLPVDAVRVALAPAQARRLLGGACLPKVIQAHCQQVPGVG